MSISNLDLFNCLVSLSGMNNAKVADLAGINRPNLYAWLSGKSQIMSKEREEKLLAALGVVDGKLSGNIVHRWRVDADAINIRAALNHLENKEYLDAAEIIFVKTDESASGKIELYNLIEIPRPDGKLTILASFNKPLKNEYPINSTKLKFGHNGKNIVIWADLWARWWNKDELSKQEFWSDAPNCLVIENVDTKQIDDKDLIASYENTILENKAEDAGLRAIIRSLLNELRKVKPESKLLDPSERADIYNEFYKNEKNKLKM